MENIKDSFNRVKQDINYIREEVFSNTLYIQKTRGDFFDIYEILNELNKKMSLLEKEIYNLKKEIRLSNEKLFLDQKYSFNTSLDTSLDRQTIIPTENVVFKETSTHIPTDLLCFKAQKDQNLVISTRNEGVQTNKQTDRQTDKQTKKSSYNLEDNKKIPFTNVSKDTPFDIANDILDSLDSLKKEIRLKFKRLTPQELLVFSTIYQLEEEKGCSDYTDIAKKLNLSESSIRDYVSRLIKKDIPIEKIKINNKEIQLSISKKLKKIVSLDTILKLIYI